MRYPQNLDPDYYFDSNCYGAAKMVTATLIHVTDYEIGCAGQDEKAASGKLAKVESHPVSLIEDRHAENQRKLTND